MTEHVDASTSAWNILLVEDNETVRRQVREYLSDQSFAGRRLNIVDIGDLDPALSIVRERKADIIILDIYRGDARLDAEQIGIRILDTIKRSGFIPVVIYTALPEGLEDHQNAFVRLVGKEAGGLIRLKAEITDLFRLRIPQVHRAIVNHMDQTMCGYMWGFVQEHWRDFEPLSDKPEFLRLIVQRLALTFAREGINQMTEEVYGTPTTEQVVSGEIVHPAECYIKPPMGQDPMFGDIRLRQTGQGSEYIVVLWPTCDMVSTAGRTPKTNSLLCARASLAMNAAEIAEWLASPSNSKQKKVERLVRNTRDESPDRYHFLPGVWDIPDLVVDFQALEHIALSNVCAFVCLATLASPFAEALGGRFQKYIGRIGTPDLDLESILAQIKEHSAATTQGGAASP
jgi:CheY-like chemotaxis protein